MTFSKEFIYKKLETISQYTKELGVFFKQNNDEQILSDTEKSHIAERLAQLIIDNMIDINQHFIRELGLEMPDDFYGSFSILGKSDVLPEEFASRIAPITAVRNILVHQYEKLDKKMFIHNLRKNFSDFEQYAQYITKYLNKKERE